MEHGDFVRAECDMWKVASLIASSTGLQGAIPFEEGPRADGPDIEAWANGVKCVDLHKKAEAFSHLEAPSRSHQSHYTDSRHFTIKRKSSLS